MTKRAYLEPNIRDTLEGGGGKPRRASTRLVQRRIARITKSHELNTQKMRFELIFELKALAELAHEEAMETPYAEMKQNWVRLAAYISQVINSISKTYDEASVDVELKRLQDKVEELTRATEGAPQA